MAALGSSRTCPLFMNARHHSGEFDEPALRAALKHCSPATYDAACRFHQTGDVDHVPTILAGILERYVPRELHRKLHHGADTLRLHEDLGLDSLTMMEIAMIAEDVLHIPISDDELSGFRYLGDVQRHFEYKLRGAAAAVSALNLMARTSRVGARLDCVRP